MVDIDSMPRLQHLTPNLRALLSTLEGDGATFEACRQRYSIVARDLASEGLGRITVSRVGDADAYWSPTQEVLEEAMRLGWVVRTPTPSARKYLDEYRDRVYVLTEAGRRAASQIDDPAAFVDLVTDAVLRAHATMRSLLRLLREAPLVMPETSESQLEQARRSGQPTAWLSESAAHCINGGATGKIVSSSEVRDEIAQWRTKRFGTAPAEAPGRKAMVDMIDDAFASIALKARDLPIGPIAFRVASGWGSALRLIDQSRYVPGFASANVVWLACDIDETSVSGRGGPTVTRRGMVTHGRQTAEAVIAAYRKQASQDAMAAPYLPLHVVRAEACFTVGVPRALGDMAIQALAEHRWPDLEVDVFLHSGVGDVPRSEPVYRRGGRRTALSIQSAIHTRDPSHAASSIT